MEIAKKVALKYKDVIIRLSIIIPTVFEQIWEEKNISKEEKSDEKRAKEMAELLE